MRYQTKRKAAPITAAQIKSSVARPIRRPQQTSAGMTTSLCLLSSYYIHKLSINEKKEAR